MSEARRRLRALLVALAVFVVVLIAMGLDARSRVAAATDDASIVRATGLSELALSTTSSWLRHPSLAAPSAGASESPLGLDVDPAGAVIARHGSEPAITITREAP